MLGRHTAWCVLGLPGVVALGAVIRIEHAATAAVAMTSAAVATRLFPRNQRVRALVAASEWLNS